MTDSGRFCYLVLAHTDRAGLLRLVRRIRELSPSCAIVVRHRDPALVDPVELAASGAVDLVSPIEMGWGSWAMVRAVLEALDAARRLTNADFFVVISGQDYPVRDLAAWEREVRLSGADALLRPMILAPEVYGRRWRVFSVPGRRTVAKRGCGWAMDRLGRLGSPWLQLYRQDRTGPDTWWCSVPRRDGANPPTWLTKASLWMTLRRDLLDQMLAVARVDGSGVRGLRTVLSPDEVVLQSLATRLGSAVRHEATSAMRWPPGGGPSPLWLTADLVRELAATDAAPFARKMPEQGWAEVVAAADAAVALSPGG